jgi:WD40 repeat protein
VSKSLNMRLYFILLISLLLFLPAAGQTGIRSIALSRDGRYLITGSSSGVISLLDFQAGEILSSSDKLDLTVASVSFRPWKTDFISAGLGSENFYTWTLTEAITTAPAETLFNSFRTAVMNNSSNMPQYGVIQNIGDEGGDFVFIKK